MIIGGFETHPACEWFPLMSDRELDELAADIRAHELRSPIVLSGGRILDGRNRLLACERAGVAPKFQEFTLAADSAVAWMVSMNLHRRHLDTSQRAMVAARLLDAFEAEARERRGRRTDLGAELRQGEAGKSSEKAAGAVRVSPRTVEHAKAVLRRGSPALVAAVEQGKISVSAAAALANRSPTRDEKRVQVGISRASGANDPAARGEGSFRLICACPQWDDTPELLRHRRLEFDAIAAPSATAVLWTTNACLSLALGLLVRWGLELVATVVCRSASARETPFVRDRHDLLLFATRGPSPPAPARGERLDCVIDIDAQDGAERRAAILGRLERMFPRVEKVELFARTPRDGWGAASSPAATRRRSRAPAPATVSAGAP
jgi:hypothetical protein